MNKLIKQLLENLFDDYDDIIQNDSDDIRTELANKILKQDVEKAKKWIRNNISLSNGNPYEEDAFINNIDNYVTFECVNNYQLNLEFTETISFNCPIPDYVRINKIKGDCTFSSSDNLPNEVDGNMEIISEDTKITGALPQKIKRLCINYPNLKSLKGIVFPQKMEYLYINCPKLKSLEGINDSCTSIGYLVINEDNLENLTGLPDSVEKLSLNYCNFQNLKGCPMHLKILWLYQCNNKNLIGCSESVENIQLICLENFSSLEGCPSQLNSLNIRECVNLKSLKYISPLITGDFSVTFTGLVDLSNGPKEVGGNYYCNHNNKMKRLNAQDTVMTGHDCCFCCELAKRKRKANRDMYIETVLKKELPKMNKSIKVIY